MVAQALHDFKTSTILVYMIINGKGSSNWLWSTWVQSYFRSFFNRSLQYSWWVLNKILLLVSSVFVCLFCCLRISCWAVEEKRRTTSSVNRLEEGLLDIHFFYRWLYTTHISIHAAIADSTHVHHIVMKSNSFFEHLVTLHRGNLQQAFWKGSAKASQGHGKSWQGARTAQTK